MQTNKFLKLNNLDNIYNSIDKCKDFVGESIPVTLNNGKLVGIITEGDLFQIFLKVSSEEKELKIGIKQLLKGYFLYHHLSRITLISSGICCCFIMHEHRVKSNSCF